MDTIKLLNYISLYGADLDSWPKNIRIKLSLHQYSDNNLNRLINNEKQFENLLLDRKFEHHCSYLQDKIISASKDIKDNHTIGKIKLVGMPDWYLLPSLY